MIFYLHGFASSANSWKVGLLKEKYQGTLIAPTLPVAPSEVVELFQRENKDKGNPQLIVGSSLGGFYAYYLSNRFQVPAVLINPSITPWLTLKNYTGMNKRYYTEEPFLWKTEYLDQLKQLSLQIKDDDAGHHLLHFYLSRDDEVLCFDTIAAQFPNAGSITFFDDCGHTFTRFAEIIPAILKFAFAASGGKLL